MANSRTARPQPTSTGLYQITYHPIKGLAIRSPQGGLTGEYFGANNPANHARAEHILNLYNTGGPLAVSKYQGDLHRQQALAKALDREPTQEEIDRAALVQEATAGARAALGRAHDLLIAGDNDLAKLEIIVVQGTLERLLELAGD